MSEAQPDVYALLESAFRASPTLRHRPRRSDEPDSSGQDPPGASKDTTGLPPTPPTTSQDGKSDLSTPINARSPPTPDASPESSTLAAERPRMPAYPSSRAESFMTAREDAFSSEPSDSRAVSPVGERLSTVDEDRGLGLAFEVEDDDVTPTERVRPAYPLVEAEDTMAGAEEGKEPPAEEHTPDREWNTELMRNVTVRRNRNPRPSPRKHAEPGPAMVDSASPASPSPRPRRTSGLRERVRASSNSPVTPSIESFAQSIGWPTEEKTPQEEKRRSTSSMGSTVVEAKIIVTPPHRRQTLRHSGKNMAYVREGSPTPERGSRRLSNRTSQQPENVPLHRLVHKRVNLAEQTRRTSTESSTSGPERNFSSPGSLRSMRHRTIDSSAATLAHQESVRRVLQPAADMLSRSNSVTRPYYREQISYMRISSAPEPVRKPALSSTPTSLSEVEHLSPRPHQRQPRPSAPFTDQPLNSDKSLPDLPLEPTHESVPIDTYVNADEVREERQPPAALMERVRQLVAEREAAEEAAEEAAATEAPKNSTASPEHLGALLPIQDHSPPARRTPRSPHALSGPRRRRSPSQDSSSLSPELLLRPSPDHVSNENISRPSYDWRRPSEEQGRVSFDQSPLRSDEHAMARHLFAQTTPFSQFSDTPIEVSEATAVSIFPHNNHSLLVVQQVSRVNSLGTEPHQLGDHANLTAQNLRDLQSTPTPPFVDASEDHLDNHQRQPTLTFEPSTPPMQITLPQPSGVDSPLKNPRPPPEPPKIMFIPPTPAEELERQLVPGPPKRSDSHPQRRLSLVQRARRYSDNLISPLLARTSSTRGKSNSGSHSRRAHSNPRVPTVNDEDGTLHPFWRPRGFWDGFDDSDSESDEEPLPQGGDTSDIDDAPAPPKRTNTFGKRLTSSFRGSGGFLIGNSLGVERHGTNKRRHHVTLPPNFSRTPKTSTHISPPMLLIQPPTMPLGPQSSGISKRGSRSSLRSGVYDMPQRRASWRQGRSLPGLKKYHVQYIGLGGVKERFREKSQEKRREKIRQSIGTRYYVEPVGPTSG